MRGDLIGVQRAEPPSCKQSVVFGEPGWALGSGDALYLLQESLLFKCMSGGGFSSPIAVVSLVVHQTAFFIPKSEVNYAARRCWELLLRNTVLLISLGTEGASSSC